MSAGRILVIGDVMIDVIVRPEGPLVPGSDRRANISVHPGGSGANQAAWLAHFGAKVSFVGHVGASDYRAQTALLREAGVEPHLAGDPTLETGRLIAIIDAAGERSFLTDRGANEALSSADIPVDALDAVSHIHLSGYSFFAPSPRAAVMAVMARASGKSVSVDPASAAFLSEVGAKDFLAWTHGAGLCLPNEDEAAFLSGTRDPQAQLTNLARHYPLVVIKRGARGCDAAAGEARWHAEAEQGPILDATGAGDAFAAAFLAARLGGAPIAQALQRANAAGGSAARSLGARPPVRGPSA